VKFNIRLNSALSVAETVVNGLSLFALYAYVNRVLGVDSVGIWALVLATGSLTRIADMGLGQGLQRKIAVALAGGSSAQAIDYVETAVMAVGVFYALLLAAIYYPASWVLQATLPTVDREVLSQLLLIAFGSFWVSQIAWLALFGLCGTHRVYLKCIISMIGNVTNVVMSFVLVPKLGILGLGIAQSAQSVLVLAVAAVALGHVLPGLRWVRLRWSRKTFRELVAYGWKLQTISVLVLAYEPVTKFLLGRFFGAEMVGLYELATRMVQQVRALIGAPNNALVPTFAALGHGSPQGCMSILRQAQTVTNYLGTAIAMLLLGMLPLISEVWIGRLDMNFVVFAALLTVGWFLGLYTAPLYYLGIALDRFRWILVGHSLMVVLNVALCVIAGLEGDARWLVLATNAALVIASFTWMTGIASDSGLRMRTLFADVPLVAVSGAAAAAAALWIYASGRETLGIWGTGMAQLAAMCAILAAGLWTNPQRRAFLGIASTYLSGRRLTSGEKAPQS
jgi:O-antigen/teichoic acid export membrane protein